MLTTLQCRHVLFEEHPIAVDSLLQPWHMATTTLIYFPSPSNLAVALFTIVAVRFFIVLGLCNGWSSLFLFAVAFPIASFCACTFFEEVARLERAFLASTGPSLASSVSWPRWARRLRSFAASTGPSLASSRASRGWHDLNVPS